MRQITRHWLFLHQQLMQIFKKYYHTHDGKSIDDVSGLDVHEWINAYDKTIAPSGSSDSEPFDKATHHTTTHVCVGEMVSLPFKLCVFIKRKVWRGLGSHYILPEDKSLELLASQDSVRLVKLCLRMKKDRVSSFGQHYNFGARAVDSCSKFVEQEIGIRRSSKTMCYVSHINTYITDLEIPVPPSEWEGYVPIVGDRRMNDGVFMSGAAFCEVKKHPDVLLQVVRRAEKALYINQPSIIAKTPFNPNQWLYRCA